MHACHVLFGVMTYSFLLAQNATAETTEKALRPEYVITIPNTHCHPSGSEMGQLTLALCEDECTRLACAAFSFYYVDTFGFGIPMTSCAMCGFRTRVKNSTVIMDGNFSSVLAPALLREAKAGYNIYKPVVATSNNEHGCETTGVSRWLEQDIFLPVVAEANASADGRLNATDAHALVAFLNARIGANITYAAGSCSIPSVNSARLKDQARAALHALGVSTFRCDTQKDRIASLASDFALRALDPSINGKLRGTLASVVSTAVLPHVDTDVIANTASCQANEALNVTLQTAVREFMAGSTFQSLLASVLATKVECARVLAFTQQALSVSMLAELNATAGGALNATHGAVLEHLVARDTAASPLASGANCTDTAVVMAALDVRRLDLMLVVSQHALFRAHGAVLGSQRVTVAMTVRLMIAEAQFDAQARVQFRAGVAAACGVNLTAVRITSVQSARAQQRRLLQLEAGEALEVETEVRTVLTEAASVMTNAQNTTELRTQVQREMGSDVDLQMQVPPTANLLPESTPPPPPAPPPPPPQSAVERGAPVEHSDAWAMRVLLATVPCAVLCVVGVCACRCARVHMNERGQPRAAAERQALMSAHRYVCVALALPAAEHP